MYFCCEAFMKQNFENPQAWFIPVSHLRRVMGSMWIGEPCSSEDLNFSKQTPQLCNTAIDKQKHCLETYVNPEIRKEVFQKALKFTCLHKDGALYAS